MFKGNVYFAVRHSEALAAFLQRDNTVANGFFTGGEGDSSLYAFHEEADAVAYARERFSGDPETEGLGHFAVLHIGPIMPAAIASHLCSETPVTVGNGKTVTQVKFEVAAVRRLAQIVAAGSFAYNRVDLSMKVFPLR
jgi:hypothetical protein